LGNEKTRKSLFYKGLRVLGGGTSRNQTTK